jgi:hypothetical protein
MIAWELMQGLAHDGPMTSTVFHEFVTAAARRPEQAHNPRRDKNPTGVELSQHNLKRI